MYRKGKMTNVFSVTTAKTVKAAWTAKRSDV